MAKDEAHSRLFTEAAQAGSDAGNAHEPRPMTIKGYAPITGGVCGFAWVTIRPATSSFARWMKKKGHARPAYGGGVQVWISHYSQSMEKKMAYAQAMADVLTEGGIKAYAGSRMD